LSGVPGLITTNDYRNIQVLSSYDLIRISDLRWAILAEIDVQEAMVPIYVTRSRILLLSIIILLVFFGCVLVIVRRITRPIIRLRDATVNLGKGKYDIELPLKTNDEIGALTASFNVMARQIKEKTTELQMERSGRMRSVFDGEEMERQRLSRELHDGIGQSLIAVKLRLENLLYLDGTERLNSINELKKYFDQIIDEVRRMSNDLMPSVLEVFSIPIAFRNLFTETEEHSNFKIYFESAGNFDDLDKKTKTYIYRLAQEALNNIVKHAQAGEVRVWLTRMPEQLSLVIQDNGIGFSPEIIGIEGGNGIHNMRERAGLLKGEIDIVSAPGKGTMITVTVPIINTHVKNQDFSRR
jgi:signal transduction histidine kinase